MNLSEYLQLPSDVRSNVAFIVSQMDRIPQDSKGSVREIGNATFVIIPELIRRTKKVDLTRLVNDLFFGWRKLEKHVRLHWHVNDAGQIKYFTLPNMVVKTAREYNERVKGE